MNTEATNSNTSAIHKPPLRQKMKFLIPSLIGAFLFLVPIPVDGQWLVTIAILSEGLQGLADPIIVQFLVGLLVFSAVGASAATLTGSRWFTRSPMLESLFVVHPFWLAVRILGAVFAVMVYFQIGPEIIRSDVSGGEVLMNLLPTLAAWSFVMGVLLPLLVDFGLMEWLGTMAQKVMRPLFRLPGRAAVDSIASWMGNNMVSILITIDQYENGYYSKREAAVIVTNFTITSIGFSLIIAGLLDLGEMFLPLYATVLVGVFVAAVICPRIPPLTMIKEDYYEPVGKQLVEEVPPKTSLSRWAFEKAVAKAGEAPSAKKIVQKSLYNAMDIWLGMLPIVMGIGTLALVIAEFTPVFDVLAYPLIPVLEWMQIPEASAAAPALLVGFADMFLPAVLASGIESELTRFVVGAVSLTQLIYLSEIGVMLMRSKIPVNFWHLLALFIIRTIITLPIVVLITHLFIY